MFKRALSGLFLFGLAFVPLTASAAGAPTPVTNMAIAQGAKVKSAIDSRLRAMKAPASLLRLGAKIQSASKAALGRAERAGEQMDFRSDTASVALQGGPATYEAVRIDQVGLASLRGARSKVALDGQRIYTESSHAISPKTSSAYFIRQRWITPVAGVPGSFRVKSHGVTMGDGSTAKDREYTIKAK